MGIDLSKIKLPDDKLNELKVGLIYLFGSYAEGFAGPKSDIDIGIVFTDPAIAKGDTLKIYNKLYDLFSDIFDLSGFKNMDIVFLERVGLELRFDAISHGVVLFETSSDFRMQFEEHIAAFYRDFKPLLREFNNAVLARI